MCRNKSYSFSSGCSRLTGGRSEGSGRARGRSPQDFAFRTMEMPPTNEDEEVARCALLIPAISKSQPQRWHWLPFIQAGYENCTGIQMRTNGSIYISGKGRMTVVDTGNKARTMDFQEGDVGYVQKTLAALRREHRRHRPGVPGDVRQGRSFSGPFFLGVAGSYSTGSGHGTPAHRQGNLRCDSQEWRRGHASVLRGIYAHK